MVFSSTTFLFYFFPSFLLLYYLLPWKNGVLLAGSLVFYAWGEPRFVPLLMLSAVLNYGFGMLIARARTRRALALGAGISVNLGLLAYYKYLGFFGAVYNQLAPAGHGLTLAAVVLPLGISFFTFQGISYLIDLYRRDIAVQTSFWRFAMYKAMFPQLIAGPIVRYSQIAADIDHRCIDNARVLRGVQQFVIGLAQKVLIANTVAMPADRIFGVDPANLTGVTAWVGAACYTIQILYDFAGYSNMAIGIGHMLGFTYPPNFRRPYAALSITDFWRRWHISLSSWFRDYLYIPLGGNRGTPARTYFNLALVFLLCGLWHGAAWTFVIWGLWHGALLVLERLGLGRLLARMPKLLAQAYTLAMVMVGWVFFRAADVPYALGYLRAMFGLGHADPAFYPWQTDVGTSAGIALVVGIALAVVRVGEGARAGAPPSGPARRGALALARTLACAAAFMLCVVSLAAGTYNPFIYFRF
jgi:alginate O-acetyltransferase complex protein AlgI